MRAVSLLIAYFCCLSFGYSQRGFSPPSHEQRARAIGQTQYLPPDQRTAFAESSHYQPKTAPSASDWLANHPEPGQTFDQFLMGRRNRFQPPRQTIYIQPLGKFTELEKSTLNLVKTYAQVYFQADVKLQDIAQLDPAQIKSRLQGDHHLQLLSTDVLGWLGKDLPADAYARIAVTMIDLYPKESWNFVFGQASLQGRVGVYSFARYGEPKELRFRRRCLRVFVHETGHMFGLRHCIHFQCVMNGSNHLQESDNTPLHLCPICLRKLHAANDFPIQHRYRQLEAFYRSTKLDEEAEWAAQRVKALAK